MVELIIQNLWKLIFWLIQLSENTFPHNEYFALQLPTWTTGGRTLYSGHWVHMQYGFESRYYP